MANRKTEQAELPEVMNKRPKGKPMPYDENRHKSPLDVVKRGVAIIYNELGRLSEASQEGGLSPSESMSLMGYVKVVSEVAKKHKGLHFGMNVEEMATMTEDELKAKLVEYLGTIDPKLMGPDAFHYTQAYKTRKRKELENATKDENL